VGNQTSYTLSGLLEGRIYYFAATAYNLSLAESGFSNEVSKAIADVTPPLISTVSASSISSSGAMITWATNRAGDSQVDYGPTTAYGTTTPLNVTLATAHAETLTGLLATTPYHYRVKSRDAAGNLATSADFTFTTLAGAVADLTPPAVSMTAPLSGATVSGTVTVSASATDNVGVVGVQFKLDGVNLGAEDTASPYAVSWSTTTASNGAHTLTAVARDAAGNKATSAPLSVTVSSGGIQTIFSMNVAVGTNPFTVTTPGNYILTGLVYAPSDGANSFYVDIDSDPAGINAKVWDLTISTAFVPENVSSRGICDYTCAQFNPKVFTLAAGAHTLYIQPRETGTQIQSMTFSLPASADITPPSLGLAGAYGFNEGSGSFTSDTSSNSNTSTINGAAWTTAGQFGNALSFNGTSSYVEAADIDALTPGTGATFEAWVSLNSAPAEIASVFNKWSQTVDDEYLFGVNPNQTLFFAWQTTGGATWGTTSWNGASGTGLIPLNTMTHIALVRNGATLSFYVNGNLDASVSAMDTNPFRNGINTLRVGRQGRGGRNRFFNGQIDEVRIYNRALTQAEIQNDMNTPIGAPPPDTTPPSISITAPAAGATVSGTITVSASASDNVGLAGVQFKLDGVNTGAEVTAAPYAVSWTATTATNGAHTLTAVARDAAGNSTTSAGVIVTISNSVPDTAPPTVSITAPTSGAIVAGTITVSASASDNVGLAGVQFKLDGANLGAELTTAPYTISWNTTTATNGAHTLTAVARDAAGNVTTSSVVSVTVANPTVSIIAPLNGARITNLTKVTVQAASSIGLSSIQIYNDSSLIGTVNCTTNSCSDLTSTVNWNTNNLAPGPHSLYTVATDILGNSTSSMPITVSK
jgi:hypothetical protein